jgi:hypothetical protein
MAITAIDIDTIIPVFASLDNAIKGGGLSKKKLLVVSATNSAKIAKRKANSRDTAILKKQ